MKTLAIIFILVFLALVAIKIYTLRTPQEASATYYDIAEWHTTVSKTTFYIQMAIRVFIDLVLLGLAFYGAILL